MASDFRRRKPNGKGVETIRCFPWKGPLLVSPLIGWGHDTWPTFPDKVGVIGKRVEDGLGKTSFVHKGV